MNPHRYPRTPYAPFSPGGANGRLTADVTNFLHRPLVITEKLDGSNIRLHNSEAHPRSPDSNGRHPWMAMVRKHHAWKTAGHPESELYGEDIYGVHTIRYDPVAQERTFYLFAVREKSVWTPWDQVTTWAEALEIPTVPVLHKGVLRSAEELSTLSLELLGQPSAMGAEREGIVIRRATGFHQDEFGESVCKVVRADHVQPDQEHWSRHWEACRIIQQGVSNA